MTEGQDWASYQGQYPSAAGLAFVGVKVTEGIGYTNPFWRTRLADVRAAGAIPLLYHYPHYRNGVASEVKYFRDTISGDVQAGDVLVLDHEGYDKANAGVPMSTQIAYKDAFLPQLQAAEPEHQVITYLNTDYLAHDPKGFYGDGLWIATAGQPEGQPGISRPWLFHQYGTRGGIDRDFTPMTPAELVAWAHAKEIDMPYTPAQLVEFAQQGAAAALADPNYRRLAVADNLWWWDHAIAGNPPAGASAAAAAAIMDIHKAFATLAKAPAPVAPRAAADASAEGLPPADATTPAAEGASGAPAGAEAA